MIGQWNPLTTFSSLLQQAFGTSRNHAAITAQSALTYPAVWYGVNKIAGHIAQLPVGVYKRNEGDNGAQRERLHPVARLLRKPNAYQTATIYREQIAVHSILQGNGRAAIVRAGGMITELIPLLPEYTATGMLKGEKVHATRPPQDDRLRLFFESVTEDDNGPILLNDLEVVHIPGLTLDGVVGLPLIVAAKRNLQISLGTESRLANQMEYGFQGNIMLQAPEGVFRKQQEAEEFLEAFEARHHDKTKAGRPGLLRDGITANILAMNNTDAQFSEQRAFQRQDAALWLGLEQILGDDTSVSYNSLEQKNLAYLMNTLNKWLTRWEDEFECKLLPQAQFANDEYYIRFETDALLKSDFKSTIEALSNAVASTILNQNEARAMINRNPIPSGNEFGNPWTSSGATSNDDATRNRPVEEPDTQAATRSRIEHLIGVECRRVIDGTRHPNYLAWVDQFYARWQSKLAVWLADLGIEDSDGIASAHCDESHDLLLESCGLCTADELRQTIVDTVAHWRDRSTAILEGSYV